MSPHPSDGYLPLRETHHNVAPGVWLPKHRLDCNCHVCQPYEEWLDEGAAMQVRPDEFVPVREASRALGKLIERLERGEIEKAVIVHRNKPRAVLRAFPAADSEERG